MIQKNFLKIRDINHLILVWKCMISPSFTTQTFPSFLLYFGSLSLQAGLASSVSAWITSALMNPFVKSEWIFPPASSAVSPLRMAHALTSSVPTVQKWAIQSSSQPARMMRSASDFPLCVPAATAFSCSMEQGMMLLEKRPSIVIAASISARLVMVSARQSFWERLRRQTMGLEVSSRYLLRTSTSRGLHGSFLTSCSFWSTFSTFCSTSHSSRSNLSGLLAAFFPNSLALRLIISRSFWISSCLMIRMSRTGSIPPSVCANSSPGQARTTWQRPSTCITWERNALPSPKPSDAPLTSPAMSTMRRMGPACFSGRQSETSPAKRGSLTVTLALLGSMVQKGMFSAGTLSLERMLKVLLLPMLAMPSSPIFREVPGRPRRTRFTGPAKCHNTLFASIIIIQQRQYPSITSLLSPSLNAVWGDFQI